jgi:lipoprotein-anchoring transpeptidase ErfK/SrfK
MNEDARTIRAFAINNSWKLAMLLLAAALWASTAGAAHADRFGPPWQVEVTADQTIVRERPDSGAAPVGPMPRGAVTILLDEIRGADGATWVVTPVGFIPAADVDELRDSWIAEVTAPSVSVYGKADAKSGVRRTARQGDLLRVTGVSAGLDGDPNIYWATTEGFVDIGTITQSTGRWVEEWTLPEGSEAPDGWWGAVSSAANVRAGATTEAAIVGEFAGGEVVKVLAEEEGESVNGNSTWYRIDGGRYAGARVHSSLIRRTAQPEPTVAEHSASMYIVVDRSARTLTVVENGQPTFTTLVAIGKAGADTPTGEYSTFGKFKADRMTSRSLPDSEHFYDLPNVPFTQYYLEGGYAIHGTYWHDRYGTEESQGCINLTWTDSAYLFELTNPAVPDGANETWADSGGATPVIVLD